MVLITSEIGRRRCAHHLECVVGGVRLGASRRARARTKACQTAVAAPEVQAAGVGSCQVWGGVSGVLIIISSHTHIAPRTNQSKSMPDGSSGT